MSTGEKIAFVFLLIAFIIIQVFYLWVGGLFMRAESIHHHRTMTEGYGYDDDE